MNIIKTQYMNSFFSDWKWKKRRFDKYRKYINKDNKILIISTFIGAYELCVLLYSSGDMLFVIGI